MSQWLGAHMPSKGGIHNAILDGKAIGCTCLQVFTKSPQMWKERQFDSSAIRKWEEAKSATGLTRIISHDSYLVNLCAPDPEMRQKSIFALTQELIRCEQLGLEGAVSHIGAHMGQGPEKALPIAAQSALEVLAESPTQARILAETTAGQGSSLNHRLEEMQKFLELTGDSDRIHVCVDTCHVFAAGYDLRGDGYEQFWSEFESKIGLSRLGAIHCNDSKKPMGSRVDRHAHLGEGEIGAEVFQKLVNDPRFSEVMIILETPEAETMHAKNLALLKSWSKTG